MGGTGALIRSLARRSWGGFIKGRFAQLSHALLYRRHQVSLHGPSRAALLWLAERINALVQPNIRIS
jgi:NADH dehydrogenase